MLSREMLRMSSLQTPDLNIKLTTVAETLLSEKEKEF